MIVARNDPGGRQYLNLQRLARQLDRPVQELLDLYVLEAFLDRLSMSDERDSFVLKGGVLLGALGSRRPTRDIDFQGLAVNNDITAVGTRISRIVSLRVDDGVRFHRETITAVSTRSEETYEGVRVSLHAGLARATIRFHIDVNVGDPITPAPHTIEVPRLLGGTISILGYPVEMVLAEKIITAVSRGTTNTRWRDFFDVVELTSRHIIDGRTITTSIGEVSRHRHVQIEPLTVILDGLAEIAQKKWVAWLRKQRLETRSTESLADTLKLFSEFADPILSNAVEGKQWNPSAREWVEAGNKSQ